MIKLQEGMIIQTKNDEYFYCIKTICLENLEKFVIAIDEVNYEFYIPFSDIRIVDLGGYKYEQKK